MDASLIKRCVWSDSNWVWVWDPGTRTLASHRVPDLFLNRIKAGIDCAIFATSSTDICTQCHSLPTQRRLAARVPTADTTRLSDTVMLSKKRQTSQICTPALPRVNEPGGVSKMKKTCQVSRRNESRSFFQMRFQPSFSIHNMDQKQCSIQKLPKSNALANTQTN